MTKVRGQFDEFAVEQTGPTGFEVTGDLTIKGVTNPVTIPFEFEVSAIKQA